MLDLIAGLLSGLVADAVGPDLDKAAAARYQAYTAGQEVRVPGSLRYQGESWWRDGDLIVSVGAGIRWAPPTMTTHAHALGPDQVSEVAIRLDAEVGSHILSGRRGASHFELAVAGRDLDLLKLVYQSSL